MACSAVLDLGLRQDTSMFNIMVWMADYHQLSRVAPGIHTVASKACHFYII